MKLQTLITFLLLKIKRIEPILGAAPHKSSSCTTTHHLFYKSSAQFSGFLENLERTHEQRFHMDTQGLSDHQKLTFINNVWTLDPVRRNY